MDGHASSTPAAGPNVQVSSGQSNSSMLPPRPRSRVMTNEIAADEAVYSSSGFSSCNDAPDEFVDQVFTYNVFTDPVKAADGFVYDRRDISKYFIRERRAGRAIRSPMTGAQLPNDELVEQNDLKGRIAAWNKSRRVRRARKERVSSDQLGSRSKKKVIRSMETDEDLDDKAEETNGGDEVSREPNSQNVDIDSGSISDAGASLDRGQQQSSAGQNLGLRLKVRLPNHLPSTVTNPSVQMSPMVQSTMECSSTSPPVLASKTNNEGTSSRAIGEISLSCSPSADRSAREMHPQSPAIELGRGRLNWPSAVDSGNDGDFQHEDNISNDDLGPRKLIMNPDSKAVDKLSRLVERLRPGDTVIFDGDRFDFSCTSCFLLQDGVTLMAKPGLPQKPQLNFRPVEGGDAISVAGLRTRFIGLSLNMNGRSSLHADGGNPACLSVVHTGSVSCVDCDIQSPDIGYGAFVLGKSAKLTLQDCTLSKCVRSTIASGNGANVEVFNSRLLGNGKSDKYGVLILCDSESSVLMEGGEAKDCGNVCVLATGKGSIRLKSVTVSHSHEREGICVVGNGSKAFLEQCKITNCGEAAVAALHGAVMELKDCTIIDSQQQAAVSQGKDSTMLLNNCVINGCKEACCSAVRGGKMIIDSSTIQGSTEMQGLISQGQYSTVVITNSTVSNTKGTCALALLGGRLECVDTVFKESTSMQGVCAEGVNSCCTLTGCTISSTQEACLVAMHGGTVKAVNTQMLSSRASRGVSIEGEGSSGEIIDGIIQDCHTASLCALNGGSLLVRGGKCARSIGTQGQGVCCQGQGSHVKASNVDVSHCQGTCLVSLSGGTVEISDSKLHDSISMQGIAAQGEGSSITLSNCEVFDTQESCVAALKSGKIFAKNCRFYRSKTLQGVVAQGKAASVDLEHCQVSDCFGTCILAMLGGSISMHETEISKSQNMQGVCSQGQGSLVTIIDSNIKDCQQTCVVALNGGMVNLTNSSVTGSQEMQGVCAEGSGSIATLTRCTVAQHKEACAASLEGGRLHIEGGLISDSQLSRGVSVEGESSVAELSGVEIQECKTAFICVLSGAHGVLTNCYLHNVSCANSQGVCSQGQGSFISMSNTRVENVSSTAVVALTGAKIECSQTSVSNSLTMQGIASQGQGSLVTLTECNISNVKEAGLAALSGGCLKAYKCKVQNCWNSRGLSSEKEGSKLYAEECQITECKAAGACALAGGSIQLLKCNFSDFPMQNAQALCCQGNGSMTEAIKCTFKESDGSVVVSLSGATVKLALCKISDSKNMQGIIAQGEGSKLSISECEVLQTKEACIAVLSGAFLDANACNIKGSSTSRGVSVEGLHSRANLVNCYVHDHSSACICCIEGSEVLLDGCRISNHNNSGQGIAVQGFGTRISAKATSIKGCHGACVHSQSGARATFFKCEIRNSITMQCGLSQGPGSVLEFSECIIRDSKEAVLAAVTGASIEVQSSEISSSEDMHILAVHAGAIAKVRHCRLHNSKDCVVAVSQGSTVQFLDSEISNSAQAEAITVIDSGSRASIARCFLSNCPKALCRIDLGGFVELTAVEFSHCSNGPAVAALSADTQCKLTGCSMSYISQSAALTVDQGATVDVFGCDIKKCSCAFACNGTKSAINLQRSSLSSFSQAFGSCIGNGIVSIDKCHLFQTQADATLQFAFQIEGEMEMSDCLVNVQQTTAVWGLQSGSKLKLSSCALFSSELSTVFNALGSTLVAQACLFDGGGVIVESAASASVQFRLCSFRGVKTTLVRDSQHSSQLEFLDKCEVVASSESASTASLLSDIKKFVGTSTNSLEFSEIISKTKTWKDWFKSIDKIELISELEQLGAVE